MSRFKSLALSLGLVILLNGCEDNGTGIILTMMGVGALAGISNSMDDDDDKTETSSTSSDETETSSNTDTDSDNREDTTTSTDDEPFKIRSAVEYDGSGDDLLTAGLGTNGLTELAPQATDRANPTTTEIRQATIVNQYQAFQDMRLTFGYGTLYGPTVPTQFAAKLTASGKIAGKEYLAYADDGTGQQNVTMMVQLPNHFDVQNPCIVAAPSPGSLGVYGAISSVGEWGLKSGCAVAYTDKGTGNGVHDLNTDTVNLIDGTREIATEVGKKAHFKAEGTKALDLAAYNSTYPFRIAQKHAHSQQNPEADWGTHVLDAIEFAFYVLNLAENFGKQEKDQVKATLTPANTIVIASGVSSAGAASLRATEQDTQDLIDGVVVASPLINPRDLSDDADGVTIKQGDQTFFYQRYRKSVFDVITYYNIYQPCVSAFSPGIGLAGRCTALAEAGWLTADTLLDQVAEAQERLNAYGTLASSNRLAHFYTAALVYAGFANLYANAYGRFSVVDNLCGYSYAASTRDQPPRAKSLADLADDFQSSRGMPPSSGTFLINNQGNEGKGLNFRFQFDVDDLDFDGDLEGALCLRHLATGTTGVTVDTGSPLTGTELQNYQRVQDGISDIFASGDLQNKPAIIVHGRDDALAHVNFTSRAYYGLNQTNQSKSQLTYIEVKNAHHFDNFNQSYGINTQIPLSYYFNQALDRMFDHLKNNADLPESQVIPAKSDVLLSITERLPAIDSDETCAITLNFDVLTIPEC
jgi:hydroxybutyrate-dimer hydrolase